MLIVLLIFVLLVVASTAQTKRDEEAVKLAWSEVGKRLGWEMSSGAMLNFPSLEGNFEGQRLEITAIMTGDDAPATSFSVSFRKCLPMDLRLFHQQPGSQWLDRWGRENHLIGDKEFDEAIVVQTVSLAQLKNFLTEERRRAILHFFEKHKDGTIDHYGLSFSLPEIVMSSEQLEEGIRDLEAITLALCGRRPLLHRPG